MAKQLTPREAFCLLRAVSSSCHTLCNSRSLNFWGFRNFVDNHMATVHNLPDECLWPLDDSVYLFHIKRQNTFLKSDLFCLVKYILLGF